MPRTTFYIYGDERTEHLRAEVDSDQVLIVSHELKVRRVSESSYADRYLCTIPSAIWVAIAKVITDSPERTRSSR